MDVDATSESLDAADSLSEPSGDYSVAPGGAAASAESTAEEKPAISLIQDPSRESQPTDLPTDVPTVSKRRFTHIPERRAFLSEFYETRPDLRMRIRGESDRRKAGLCLRHYQKRQYRCTSPSGRRCMRKTCGRSGYPHLETLFELPFVTENNVVIFSKPQKLRRSVDEVDQLMRKLDLHKEKSKMT